ncbi:MAG: ATP-binding protein [Dehalococcoidales bacterium]|nr:ATP-binding protein [Dehalococcoidales bacterium]
MINKDIDQITEEDIQALKDNSVSESKTIEYKQQLPGNSDLDKQEFLADISAFANASGGDLIFGVTEDAGIPISVEGLAVDNIDREKLRIENIVRDGIQPRISGINIKAISLSKSGIILLIRVPKSWNSPHRVVFKGHDKFYSRNSSGKYPMDVTELRIDFNLSESLAEKIRNFNIDRISKIIADETPVPLYNNAKISLLLIPMVSFSFAQLIDISRMSGGLKPIYCSGFNDRHNLDGLLSYSAMQEGKAHSYVQLYRNGIIEAAEALLLEPNEDGTKVIPSIAYEMELMESVTEYLTTLKNLNIDPPILLFLNFLGVKGYKMSERGSFTIDRDCLMLQEIIVESYDFNAHTLLKPAFDSIWNACGFPQSFNYTSEGKWVKRR